MADGAQFVRIIGMKMTPKRFATSLDIEMADQTTMLLRACRTRTWITLTVPAPKDPSCFVIIRPDGQHPTQSVQALTLLVIKQVGNFAWFLFLCLETNIFK